MVIVLSLYPELEGKVALLKILPILYFVFESQAFGQSSCTDLAVSSLLVSFPSTEKWDTTRGRNVIISLIQLCNLQATLKLAYEDISTGEAVILMSME